MVTFIEITFFNHQTMRRRVDQVGWKINTAQRCLIIGHGVPRLQIPLDNVLCFEILHPEWCAT